VIASLVIRCADPMTPEVRIADRSLSSRLGDAVFVLPACLFFYAVTFLIKYSPEHTPSVLLRWFLALGTAAVVLSIVYSVLHSINYRITNAGVLRTERRIIFLKREKVIRADAITEIAIKVGKNTWTGSSYYMLLLRLKSGRSETMTSSDNEAQIRNLQTSILNTLERTAG
jgi:hypothetical protein